MVQKGRTETRRLLKTSVDYFVIPILGCMQEGDGFLDTARRPTAVGCEPVDIHRKILRVRVVPEARLGKPAERSIGGGVRCGSVS